LLRRLYRALSRRSYNQLSALKPVFGLARPSLAWSKELRPRQLLHDLPPVGRWLADHDQILAWDDGYLVALGTPGKRVPIEGETQIRPLEVVKLGRRSAAPLPAERQFRGFCREARRDEPGREGTLQHAD
jgi:hypothetical protein